MTAEGGGAELSPEEKKANATNLLRTYRGTGKGIPKNAVTSVSGNAVIVRYVKFQKLTRKELSKTIKAEAEPYIPFNVEEVYIGFHPLQDVMEEGKQKMETVLVAAKKDFINARIEILEGAGFKPAVIDVDAFAMESVYEAAQDGTPNETVLIANIGYAKTNFVILENGVSLVVKDSPVSGSAISKSIMKSLGVDSKTAEKLKISHGLLTPEEREVAPKEAQGVADAAGNVAKDLSTEIKKIIQYYTTQGKDKRVNRVLITGGSANIKNLVPYLANDLSLPVEKLNPFAKVGGAQGIPEEYWSTLSIAVGLAMRHPGDVKD
jgi:type IV pilus assembly protein PilM